MKKRGFELSFTFIFSLILIAVFIFVAIWAIKHFLELKDRTLIQSAIEDLKNEVWEVWQAEESKRNITLIFPSTVKGICFANLSKTFEVQTQHQTDLNTYKSVFQNKEKNVFVIPFTLTKKYDIEGAYMIRCGNVNCLNFTNPTCKNVVKGKINLMVEGLPDGRVRVS